MSQTSTFMAEKGKLGTLFSRIFRHYTEITSRVFLALVGVIALFGVPAYFLDHWLGTWPVLFGVSLILALPVSQVLVIKLMLDYLKNNPQK